MRDVNFQELSKDLLTQLVKGVFLTVKKDDEINTMTIGWGNVGFMWNKPMMMVPVRYSRYTYQLIDNTDVFTVSVPVNKEMKEALAYCGTKSGRDVNKIKACNLTLANAQMVDAPIISDCDLHIECKIVYKQTMEPGTLDQNIKDMKYPNGDYHVMYYGEIVKAYYLD